MASLTKPGFFWLKNPHFHLARGEISQLQHQELLQQTFSKGKLTFRLQLLNAQFSRWWIYGTWERASIKQQWDYFFPSFLPNYSFFRAIFFAKHHDKRIPSTFTLFHPLCSAVARNLASLTQGFALGWGGDVPKSHPGHPYRISEGARRARVLDGHRVLLQPINPSWDFAASGF